MDKKEAASIIKDKILSKVAEDQLQPPAGDSAQKVINLGSGIPFFKPMTGSQVLGVGVTPLTPEKLADEIASFMNSIGYTYNTKIDPKNYDLLAEMISKHLRDKFSGYLNLVNPEYLQQ